MGPYEPMRPVTETWPMLFFPIHMTNLHVGSTNYYDNVCYMGSGNGWWGEFGEFRKEDRRRKREQVVRTHNCLDTHGGRVRWVCGMQWWM